VRVYVR